VHANLTPDAILVNAKGDWKIAGLGFCGPHETSTAATSLAPIQLFEVLNHDPRLPRGVQLNLDYTSPDFVLDNTLVPSADMFSLGLLILALYNSPHSSPLSTGGSLSSYKRIFASSSSVPTQGNNFLVPSTHPLPPKLKSELLPKLITRRPANRLTAREFQEASYFDNILVSTMRFLDALPAKTPNEKAQFMRGLPRIMPQFPKSVLEKKVLPALLEEMKDREILALILTNVFAMVKAMPSGKRAFTEKVVPRLREIFLVKSANGVEKDTSREAGHRTALAKSLETISCPSSYWLSKAQRTAWSMRLCRLCRTCFQYWTSAPSRTNCSPSLLKDSQRQAVWLSKSEGWKRSTPSAVAPPMAATTISTASVCRTRKHHPAAA
jgi:SCY1-like protein 2